MITAEKARELLEDFHEAKIQELSYIIEKAARMGDNFVRIDSNKLSPEMEKDLIANKFSITETNNSTVKVIRW